MSAHKLEKTIRPAQTECKDSNVRPRCPKCSGLLMPELAFVTNSDEPLVISVGCMNCGERFFRGIQRRQASKDDRNPYKMGSQPGHIINGRKLI